MNRKEIFIICLVICCIFSLHAVAAVSDQNTTDDIGIASDNVSTYSLPNADNQLLTGSENADSFTHLQDAVKDGGEVNLIRNYTYASSDAGLAEGVLIDKNITINGNGNVIIDADNQARIFNIANGINVILKGITFVNGNADGNGGSINSMGLLTIVDCNFINNTAEGHGGAIYIEHSTSSSISGCEFTGNIAGLNGGAVDWHAGSSNGVVENSVFKDNVAKRSGGAIHWSGHNGTICNSNFTGNNATGEVEPTDIGGFTGTGDGGAVIWVGSHGVIKDGCEFINNTAKNRGGAVFLHGNNTENCTNTTIDGCTFTGNVAGYNGGAVDWHGGSSEGVVENSVFRDNIAKRSGGAIHWSGNYGTISNSKFIGNNATGDVVDTIGGFTGGGDGGAVIWVGSHGTIKDNCEFINNTAANRGGAVFLHGNDDEICDNTTVDGCTFTGNVAGYNGGAVDWHAGATNGEVLNSIFRYNVAKRSGGAIHWSGTYGIISNSKFIGNNATGDVVDTIGGFTGGGDGGAIVWIGSHGIIKNDSEFINNTAANRGGAVFLHGNHGEKCINTTVDGCTFTGNVAGYNGGAIDWHAGAVDGNILNSIFRDNVAKRSGGAIHWSGDYSVISNSTFIGNNATGDVVDTIGGFTGGGDGGAILVVGSHAIINESCRFVNNFAANRGGAIFFHGNSTENCTNTTIDHSNFENNIAGADGGAIYWYEGSKDGFVNYCNFINNTAMRNGGAIRWSGINGTIKNSKFTNNRATGETLQYNIAINSLSDIIVVNDTLPENPIANRLYVVNHTNMGTGAWFESYVFVENGTSLQKIFLCEEKLEGSHPSPIDWGMDNFFGGDGGSILWSGDIGLVDNCTFIDSNSARRGGGAYMTGSDHVTYQNCNFTNCTSGTNGGGLDWLAGANYGKVVDCIFNNTEAARSAGAIYYDGDYGEFRNIIIENSYAHGGDLKVSHDGKVHYVGWDSSHWDTNTTGGDAGAIMITGDHVYIYNATFTNCTAVGRGGAVFLQDNDNVTFDLCTFENNRALGTANNTYNNARDTDSGLNKWYTGNGGAVGFDKGASNGTIINSKFINNTAARNGGAVSFSVNSTDAYIFNSSFVNNTAYRSGGALEWDGTDGDVSYCNFTGNSALGTAISTEYAVLTSLSNVIEVTSLPKPSIATDNKLYVRVIYDGDKKVKYELWVSQVADIHYWLQIDETTETGPSAIDWAMDEYYGGDGGSIYWAGDNATIDHCIFIDSNSARRGGGAYMTGGDHVEYVNCTFENCTSGTNGGGLDWLAGANYGKVIDCNFTNTEAARSAGAIYYDGDYGEFRNIIIRNATAHGGDLYESRDGKVHYVGWDSSHWDTNTTGGDAGAIMITGDHIYLYNVNITDSTAAGRGGAVFVQDNDNVTFESCYFENNRALGTANNTYNDPHDTSSGINKTLTGHGGAISFDIGATHSSIIGSTFINNTAELYGGAVHFREGASEDMIINSSFTKNHANEDGGALFVTGFDCELHNSTFYDNYAGDDGGAIYWNGGDGIIHNITCVNNSGISSHGNSKGGTLCLVGDNMALSDSTFNQSYAKVTGGAIFATGNYVNITGCDFYDCNVTNSTGGGIQILGNHILVSDCTLEECHANYGSAIYAEGQYTRIVNSTFTHNNATEDGGAVYVSGDYSELHNSTFTYNFAGDDGGAIYWEGDYGTINNITCENNKGISLDDSNSNGGTICITGNDIALSDSTFKNSSAVAYGGAIYVTGNRVNITGSEFETCNSTIQGGAIYILGDETVISECSFEDCNGTQGGAIYVEGNDVTISANITDTHAMGADSYGITVDYKFYKDVLKVVTRNLNSMIEYVANMQNITLTQDQIANILRTLQNLSVAIENSLTDDGISMVNLTKAIDILTQLDQTLTQLNATLPEGQNKNDIIYLLDGVKYIDGQFDYITDIYNSADVPTDLIGDIDTMSSDVNGLSSAVDKDELQSALNNIKGDVEKILDGNTFSSTYIEDALRLLNNLNETLAGLSVSGNDKTIVNKLIGEVKDAASKLNSLYDLVVVPEVVASGGAIYVSGNGALINNSVITSTDAIYGGAVFISGDGAIIDNSVVNNTNAVYGGGIYITGHDVTVDHSDFINLYATEDGGAIYITGQRGKLYNSKFINNTAGDDGGAINWDGNYGTINNITCENNRGISFNGSSSNGGTIALTGDDTSISQSSFKDTYALISGGAIFVTGNRVNITDSEFENCNVSMDIAETGKNYTNGGGAIYLLGDSSNVVNCTFDNSKAREGGVIYVQGNNITIDNAKSADSFALNGGAFYVSGNHAVISNSTIDDSNASYSGGAVFIDGIETDIIKSSFTNTNAFGSEGNGGGAIFIKGENADIVESNFTNNYANSNSHARGGAMYITGANAEVVDSKFTNAHSNIQGGAIYVNGTNTIINGSEFNECKVDTPGSEGGSIYIEGENTIIEGSNFIDSSAVYRGGAIYIDGSNAKVKDSNFTDSSVTGGASGGNPRGGAIYIKAVDAVVEGSIFTHSTVSTAVGEGGAIYIEGNYAKILGSGFESSSANTGGAIYLEGNYTYVNASSVNGSYAESSGGALYSKGSNSKVEHSNFTNNLVKLNGGALYWSGESNSKYNTVDGCIFTNNTAYGYTTHKDMTRGGGAIYWSEGGTRGTVKNSEFYYNSVQSINKKKVDGGAILWDKSYHALVENCIFVGNFVTTDGDDADNGGTGVWAQGGAMYLRPNANYTVRNCLFENCSSSKEAGALYIQGKTKSNDPMILLENSVFINNVAYAIGDNNNKKINGGGAIQIKQCTNSEFRNLTFINNTANKGGALCVFDQVTNLVVDGANFTGNKAEKGSAISASKGFTLKNAVLLENRANTDTFDLTFNRANAGSIDILLKGKDNSLNAMYAVGATVTCSNVTYWTNDNKLSGKTAVTSSPQAPSSKIVPEAGISITVELFDANNNKLNVGNDIFATDADGKLHLTSADFDGISSFEGVYVVARLTNEDYYTQVINTTRLATEMQVTTDNAIYHRNATAHVTITPASESPSLASGTVSVYYGDVFLGNITITDNAGVSDEILTNITADKFLEVGVHNLTFRYWGDRDNDAVNLTVPLNVTKAQSNITFAFDEMGYDLFTYVTIVDEWNGKYYADANGIVTLTIYKENSTVPLQSKTIHIFEGTGFTLFDLLPANYTIKAEYHGDDNYNASVNSTPAELHKKEDVRILIIINATDIMVDEEVYINITVLTNGIEATGNITLYLDNEKYILPLNNNSAQIHVGNLTAGEKIVIVCYDGSRDLQANSGDANFTVHKYNTTFEIGVTNITHNQKEIINITFLNETTGVVYITVDGRNYSAVINNRTAILELVNLTVGEHNVTVTFPGDWKYNNVTNMTRFYVNKIIPEVIIDVDNVTYGNPTTVVIDVPDCVSGNVTIKVNGQPYGEAKQIENGKVVFDLGKLNAGEYTLEAIYSGDANHTGASYEQDFCVYKDNRTIDIEVENIIYGAVEHIKVHVNATGTVTIRVNGKSETVTLDDNGDARLNVSGLAANTYAVDVTYNGNDNYNKSSASKEFVVSKMTTSLDVEVHDVFVRDMEYINITVRNSTGDVATDLNGILTIDVDGVSRTVNVVNGKATFYTAEFNKVIGKRTVWAFFDGNVNFTASRDKETYMVNTRTLLDDEWNVTARDIYVGEAGNITVNLPKDVTGFVEIEVKAYDNYRDDTYYTQVIDGVAVTYPKDLREGKYHVYVTYIGTDYTESYLDTHFTVSKRNVNVTIDVNDTVYDNTSNIVVYVDDGVEGSITIRIGDVLIGTYGIVDGKVNTTVELGAGTYTVYAEYNGNYMYLVNKTESKGFTVYKATPAITIDVPDAVDANANATIVVRINQTATGNITLTVNGTRYNATIENGVAVFVIDKLLSGKYDVTAEYDGDNNYTAAAVTLTEGLTVDKVSCYQINVTANDTKVGWNSTITVRVPADAVGNVSIYVDGVFVENVTVLQGIAQLNVTRPYGNHTVNVTFTDDKYGFRYAIADFWVFKHDSPLVIDVDSVLVGDVAYINVTAPSDNVTIEINGVTYNSVRYEDGIAYFEVTGLEHGNKTVVAIYGGSEKYVQNTTTKGFKVSKRSSQVNLTVNATAVGNDVIINVTIPGDAVGYVIVVVDGQNYSINTTGGMGSLRIPGLGNITHYVNVTYAGDEQYLPSSNSTSFTLNKVNSTVSVAGVNITLGDVEIITVTVPVDATGNVTVEVVGIGTYTVTVANGTGILVVKDLAVGTYTLNVRYNGDGKYLSNNNHTQFTVSRVNTTADDIMVIDQGNGTVVVIVPENATGNVTITVGNHTYVANVTNGTAVIDLVNETPGTHNITVIYSGDGNYTNVTLNSTVSIPKIVPAINVNVTGIYVGDVALINVTLPKDATGDVTIEINGVEYTPVEFIDGIARFRVENLAFGVKTVAVVYSGDHNYTAVSTTANFTVSKRSSQVNVTVNATTVGKDVVINVTIPSDAEGYVVVVVDGQNYSINTTNGIGSVTIPGLGNATHNVNVTYLGDEKYLSSTNGTNFTVNKVDSTVSVEAQNITLGDVEIITISVPADATGNVTVNVVGVGTYTVPVANGTASLIVKGLPTGTYTVDVRYNGDGKYLTNTNATTFKVSRVNTTEDDIKVIDKGNGTVVVVVPENATGNVTIKIGNHTYTANVTNGTAVIDLVNETPGTHNITVIYSGDGNYTNVTLNSTISIPKIVPAIDVNVTGIYVGDVALINVTLPNDATGDVTIEINGVEYTPVEFVDGIARFRVENLAFGVKTVAVSYAGDNNYTGISTTANFTVSKRSSQVNVTVNATTVGKDVIINVTIPSDAKGYVVVVVDGQNYSINTTNGIGSVTIPGLGNTTHNVNVTYLGDEKYLSSTNGTSFTLNKVSSTVSVEGENITLGDVEIITISVPADAIGNVTVNVVGVGTYTVPVANGTASLIVKGLPIGTYTVNVRYNGDGKYLANTNSTTFKVSRVNTTEDDIKVIDKGNGTVVVVVPNNATGNVTIKVGNNTYVANVTNGTAVIDLVNETPGTHNITLIYSGDGNYTNVTLNATVSISKMIPTIKVNVTDIYVGDVALINVTLPSNAVGTVTIEINGVEYAPYEFRDGIARFRVADLAFGVKTVAVVYSGDDNYTGISTTANFTVSKRSSQVNLTVNATTVGKDVVINVTIPSDAEGYVVVVVDGQNYSINTTNGIGSVTIPGLGNATHNVNVTYLGDEKYLSSTNGTSFTLNKVDSTVSVEGENITLGDVEIITISVPVDAAGNVTVEVVGIGTYTVPVANGTASLIVKGLPIGTYTVNVRYNGDGKYLTNTNSTIFKVSRVNTTEDDIRIIDKGNGTVVVVVPENATGNVTVKIGNHTYVANVTNGTAVIDLVNETPGTHEIEVIYSGDGNYINVTLNSTVSIPKLVPTINVNVTDIYVGDVALINVTLPKDATGDVTIEINGIEYTPYEFTNGVARFRVTNLAFGVKTVAVNYAGDHNYTSISTTANFTVSKRSSQVNVTVNATVVGKDVIINVTIPSDAEGYVVVVVDGQNYSINTTNGIGSVTIPGLGNATHNVNVTYLGDEKYLSSTNGTSFTVNKVDSTVSVEGENITLGDVEIITISVPVDAVGNVTVNVVGVGTYTVPVANGTGILVVKNLAVGTYTVNVSYNGDGKYLTNANSTTFKVSRVNTTEDDIRVIDKGNGTVVVVVPENATGNVTVKIGNNTYVANVTNGTAVIDLVNETPGTHEITVIYSGDGNYTNVTLNSTVSIPKLVPAIDVNVTGIYVGDAELINVTLPKDATGDVTIEIDGKTYEPYEFRDGIARFKVENLTAGVKTVAVKYSGDANYTANFTTANFTVSKRPSYVKVNVSDIDVGQTAVINVTIPENATGQVIVSVGGNNYTINMTGSTGSVPIRFLESGEYNIIVTYMGNDEYLSSINNTESFTVSKLQPVFTVTGTNITYGEPEFIEIRTDSNITGKVMLEINGKNYSTFINEGRGNLTIMGLDAGKYNITAYFDGNNKYLNATAKNNFTISKAKPFIKVVPQNITFGDKEIITVYVNATGKVNITVDGIPYDDREIIDGKVELELMGYLCAGNYTADVAYSGNGNYGTDYAHANFTVAKKDPSIRVVVQNITYGGVEHIIVYVNASGNVTIKVNGTERNIILREDDTAVVILRATIGSLPEFDGRAHEYLYNLNAGEYPVEVIYHGNDNYNEATANTFFLVYKANTTVSIDVDNITAKGREIINVTVNNANATGYVVINVDGVNYTRPITSGTATLVLDNVGSGNHSVVAIYEGDGNLNGNWSSAIFSASKVKPEINVVVNDTHVGQSEKITVELPENATGYVVIDVDGTKYHVDIPQGARNVTIEVDGLKNKTYTVTATYSGDDYYEEANDTDTFSVGRLKAEISVSAENITYGDKAVITVTTPEDLYGNVTVSVNGENHIVYVSGGHGTLVVPGLDVGKYPVDVTFAGNEKYEPTGNSTEFSVSKIETDPADIKVIDQNNGTVVVVVPGNATGNVTIKVGDDTFNATVVDGVATVTLGNVTPGTHEIEVFYSGDGNHTNATLKSEITVPKLTPSVSISVDDIKVGDAALINVTLPGDAKGDVTVEIDGKVYTPYEFKDGVARFKVENLTSGVKTVAVRYSGDNNYTDAFDTANFTVSKRQSSIDVTVNATTVGNDVIINVTIPGNATGYVIVKVGGQNYSINTTGGVGSVRISGLGNTTHSVSVTYLGDDQYMPSTGGAEFTLDKVDSTVSAVGENITVGDKEVITVKVPVDATGNVTVEIVGVGTFTIPVANGTGILLVKDLKAGTYDVNVRYNGDDKYLPSDSHATFKVSKVDTIDEDIKVIDQGNGTVVVVVPNNATGNVTVKVKDHTYVANVTNGTAVIQLDNETPGTHDIEVVYSGDDKYSNATVSSSVTVPKLSAPIKVDTANIQVGDAALINVTLPDDATGDVTIEIDGKIYTPYEFKDGVARFKVENLTSGVKTVVVKYSGDDNYISNFTTSNFTVSKRSSTVYATITDADVGDNVTVTVFVPEDATGQVLIDIDGVGYYVNVTGGKGTVDIPRIPSGVYPVNLTYTGDDKYLPSHSNGSFNVNKVASFVIPTAQDIPVGANEFITIQVPEDATGNVTLIIDGEEYVFNLNDGTLGAGYSGDHKYSIAVSGGKGSITITGLPKGEYVVSVKYNGDDKYLQSSNTTTFIVYRDSTDMEIKDLGNGTVVVELPEDAKGNVTVTIDNQTYVVNVTNGTAVIDLVNATPGTHDITVKYSGDGDHPPQTVNSTVSIPKRSTPIRVDVSDIYVGDTATVTVHLPDEATGEVEIEINGKKYTGEAKDGKAVIKVNGLAFGDKTVAVTYGGDKYYVENFTTAQFKVLQRPSSVSASSPNVKYGNDGVITVTVPADQTGRVLVNVNGIGYYATIKNGKAKVVVPDLAVGSYKVTVTYEGDDKYLPSTTTTSFKVTKSKSSISSTGDVITEGENANVVIDVPKGAKGSVTIKVNGKKYTAKVKNGKARFKVSGLKAGSYNVHAKYSGDRNHEPSTSTTKIVVHKNGKEKSGSKAGSQYHEAAGLEKHATGNPILILLLVILALGSTQIRRFKK